ncbi:MAG: chromosomal replication initiator protein DnaA [Bacteroidales bacterium]|nr:chromosomal replication initiator protein DnaA [Bacteroidales bacterium]
MKNTHISIWNNCLSVIRDLIPEKSFKAWFNPIEPVSLEGSVLTIEVPSDFVREYIEENYIDILSKVLRKEIGPDAGLKYRVRIVADQTITTTPQRTAEYQNKPVTYPGRGSMYANNPYVIPGIQKDKIDPQLNPTYNFNNFVEGECNRLGRTAGMSIAANPGKSTFNPFFIYGGSGRGKTHLAQAIGIAIKENFPEKVVLYVSANRFMTQFMDSVSVNNKLTDFLRFYQSIDVLIIDDVHEFADKKGTQNAFYQIFNHLQQTNKQLILTSDRAPAEMQGLTDRMLSRFRWGLSAELLAPDYTTRYEILKSKSLREGVSVPDEVLEYIARNVTGNVRELEGTLFSLIANATFAKKDMTLALAQGLIEKIVTDHQSEITVAKIQETVCSYFGITSDMMLSKTRKREIVQARQIAMYLSRNLTKTSLSSIGIQIGGKDHATVLHAYNTVCDLIDTDRTFKQYVVDIERKLNTISD